MNSKLHNLYFDRLERVLSHCVYGSLELTTPSGSKHFFQGVKPGVSAQLTILDWRMLPAFSAKGDIGLTEAYREGWWSSNSLVDLFVFGLENDEPFSKWLHGNIFSQISARILYFLRRNSIKGSKRNIRAHYDLSNDFYRLWLDESMTYSAAIFDSSEEPLLEAQYRKYDRMLDRLNGHSGRLLEIGCGWGGLAERAIERHDFQVTGLTLSKAQLQYAQKRLEQQSAQAQLKLQDYRHQEGKFDSIVSIEMFEAVGEKYWPTFFAKLKSLLSTNGRAQIQTITIDNDCFPQYRKRGDMIRTFIFPGGMLPSFRRFQQEAIKAGLKITDHFDFGKDYGKTCERWLQNFETHLPQVRQLGFDEAFIRVWRFYLAGCIAGFRVGRTSVMQMELQHA